MKQPEHYKSTRPPKGLTAQEKARLIYAYKNGVTRQDLATRFHISIRDVTNILLEAGIPSHWPRKLR